MMSCPKGSYRRNNKHPSRRGSQNNQDHFLGHLPEFSKIFAIPYELSREGIQKHGQMGDIHRRALGQTERVAQKTFSKVISIYIGKHTNIAAIKDAQAVDVSDGFCPSGGIFSETSCGAIDSSIVFQLLSDGVSPTPVARLLSQEGGFKALAGKPFGVSEIFNRRDAKARFAQKVFGYHLLKYIGAFSAVLDGLDSLVFVSEGGEGSKRFVLDFLSRLKFLGITKKNEWPTGDVACLTSSSSKIKVYFINHPSE